MLRILALYYLLSSIFSIFKSIQIITTNKTKRFVHFDYHQFLVTPFYWIRHLNLKKYGFRGISKYMGTGNHDMSLYWYYTKLSLYLNYKMGASFYILSGIILAVSFLPFLNSYYSLLFFFFLLLNSKCYHYFVFVSQNYNALAWSISPVYLYLSFNDQYVAASLVLLLISFLGFTTTTCLIFISFGIAIDNNDFLFILVPAISIFKLSTHIFLSNGLNGIADKISKTAKAIGFSKSNTKYIRRKNSFPFLKFTIACIFTANLYFQFGLNSYCLYFALVLFFINFKVSRFSDHQSFDILLFIIKSFFIFNYELYDLLTLSIFALSSNFLLFHYENPTFIKKPISSLPIINKLNSFFQNIPANSKIYFSFSDPKNVYDDCFDKQRFLLDYPVLSLFKRNILLFPDYSALFDHNKEDSISLWANCPVESLKQLNFFKADYTICYQEKGSILNPKWTELGFKELATFDWHELVTQNFNINLWWYGTPKWFLLKKPANFK